MIELEPTESAYRRPRPGVSLAAVFWCQLAAVTLGVLVAGVILFGALRLYAKWSAQDALKTPPAWQAPR